MTREETIEIVKSAFSAWESEFRVPNDDWSEEHEALDMAIEALKADRPRGTWLKVIDQDGILTEYYVCDKCGMLTTDCSNFCPNCGAKMDEK